MMTAINRLAASTCLALVIAATAAGQDRAAAANPEYSPPKKSFTPASIRAQPGLECQLYPAGITPDIGIPVFTDDDGYARFYAVQAEAGDTVRQLSLDCTDAEGHASLYTVDLSSDETFVPRPLDLSKERGVDRPAITSDPMSYTQAELIQSGYGLRPDPQKDPEVYAEWLDAASRPGRILMGKPPARGRRSSLPLAARGDAATANKVTTTRSNLWLGSEMTGQPNYLSIHNTFNVPKAVPGGDETTATEASLWGGLGGLNGSGLIQSGIFMFTNSTAASYQTFREYCCGDGASNNYSGNYNPSPGDSLFTQNWYCDSKGNVNLNGGYGCSFVQDKTSGAILSCTSSKGSPCPSAPALTLCSVNPEAPNCMTIGLSAEFIIEDDSPQDNPASFNLPPYYGTVTMTGAAESSATNSYSQTVTSDPTVTVNTDGTGGTSHIQVSLGTSNQTYFNGVQFLQVSGQTILPAVVACGGSQFCNPELIAVGPNSNGSNMGTPWVLGSAQDSAGDFPIYQWQWKNNYSGTWVQKPGHATMLAVSPEGVPWAINHAGTIYYWTGSTFTVAPDNGCAHWIGVGPSSSSLPHGSPWVIGCQSTSQIDGSIYQLQGSTWVKQPGAASQIAVSPEGTPWVVNAAGNIYFWNGITWQQTIGCAVAIAVGPNNAPLASAYGDAWALGCGGSPGGGYNIFQFQQTSSGPQWVQIPGRAWEISVSPDIGVPWVVNSQGKIYQ